MITLKLSPLDIRADEPIEKDGPKVLDMMHDLQRGHNLPAIQVREHGHGLGMYYMVDGHHRLEAHKRCGKMIAAEVTNR